MTNGSFRFRPLAIILRFFCGRKGAAMARFLITVWTVTGLGLGSFVAWAAHETWGEFIAMRAGIAAIQVSIAGNNERWTALRDEVGDVKAATRALTDRVTGIDLRLAREEGARREGRR